MNIGFAGTGKMGSGMARNLMKAGHQVTVYNRSRKNAEPLLAEGARWADTAAGAADAADAIFTMLPDDSAVSEVVFGEHGIESGLKPGSVHLSSSTISVAFAKRLAGAHEEKGQRFISACVFGRPEAAESKKLIVVAAGDGSTVERCRPLFEAIGRTTFVAGAEPWHANLLKLCGNFMIASLLESFGEAYAVQRKAGLDPHTFLDVMNELFQSPVYKNYGGLIADQKFEPAGFALKLGLKDVRQVVEAAQDLAAPMPVASVIRDQFISAMAHGQEAQDWSSVARVAARSAGLPENADSAKKASA